MIGPPEENASQAENKYDALEVLRPNARSPERKRQSCRKAVSTRIGIGALFRSHIYKLQTVLIKLKMGRGKKSVFKTFDPPLSGHYVWAPMVDVSQLVDMYSTILFINEQNWPQCEKHSFQCSQGHIGRGRHPKRESGAPLWCCGRLASSHICCRNNVVFSAPGSSYMLHIKNTDYPQCGTRVDLPGSAAVKDTLDLAVRASSQLLGESVDPKDLFFRDTVASRLRMFKRSQTQDETTMESEEKWYPPLPPGQVVPFAKPASTRLGDLLHAFATHAVDRNGKIVIIKPSSPPPLVVLPLPFLFCSVCK